MHPHIHAFMVVFIVSGRQGLWMGPDFWALDRMPCRGSLAKWMVPPDFQHLIWNFGGLADSFDFQAAINSRLVREHGYGPVMVQP